MIRIKFSNATLLQTGDPMCGVAHPEQAGSEENTGGLGLRAEAWKCRKQGNPVTVNSEVSVEWRLQCQAEPVEV